MKKTIAFLKNTNFNNVWMPENGNKPDEWKTFCRTFKSEMTKILKKLNCTNIKFDNQYFEISVWLTAPNGTMWYLHLSDVRFFPGSIFFRTVTSYTDYHGGSNHNTNVNDVTEILETYIR